MKIEMRPTFSNVHSPLFFFATHLKFLFLSFFVPSQIGVIVAIYSFN